MRTKSEEQKSNLAKVPRRHGEFVAVHYAALRENDQDGRKRAPTEIILGEMINGLSLAQPRPDDGRPAPRMDRLSYKDLSRIFNRSKSTIARSIQSLDDDGLIGRMRGKNCMEYEGKKEFDGALFASELWLYSASLEINGEKRCATYAEISVFQHIAGKCTYEKNKEHTYTATYKQIAEAVNVCERTAKDAVRFWINVGYLTCPKKDRGYRGKASTYHIASIFRNRLKRIRRGEKTTDGKEVSEREKASTSESAERRNQIEDANARTERERFYASRKQQAVITSENAKKQAFDNPEYRRIYNDINDKTREMARAEAFHLGGLEELKEQIRELESRRTTVLAVMGLTDADFEPKYHCRKCSDSGFLPNGKACDCYHKIE